MKILVTNDDGIGTLGLDTLVDFFSSFAEVVQIIPDRDNSYISHRVHTKRPLRCNKLQDNVFTLDGAPADCIRVGLRGMGLQPDWVISGINHGGNLGVDTFMSGTVAAAREAAFFGVKSIAFSRFMSKRNYEEGFADAPEVLDRIFTMIRSNLDHSFWNVNMPTEVGKEIEIVNTFVDTSPHDVRFEKEGDDFKYAGVYQNRQMKQGGDVYTVLKEGKVSVTALTVSPNP